MVRDGTATVLDPVGQQRGRELPQAIRREIERAGKMRLFEGVFGQCLDEREFLERYTPLVPFILPDLVLIAERDGETVGFLFAIPDWHQRRRGASVDTIVIKTVAVQPGRAQAGLGRVLTRRCEQRAAAAGFRRSIHALMADPGTSLNISSDYAQTMRRYTLFGRPLP